MDLYIKILSLFMSVFDESHSFDLRPIADAPPSIFNFSSTTSQIASLCGRFVPGWENYQNSLEISQLCEGLSNQNFRVSLVGETCNKPGLMSAVLFRIHGSHSNQFYEPSEEFLVFKTLSKLGIGPQLIAHGEGWRIEEWHDSYPVPFKALANPSIHTQVAAAVGRFHKLSKSPLFPKELPTEPAAEKRLKLWSENASKISGEILKLFDIDSLLRETSWLTREIDTNKKQNSSGYQVVFCHNDVQENNLLQTPYGIRIIDFEYSHFNYQSFDIANFFLEFTMDYTVKTYPFFATHDERYPGAEAQVVFASVYLSELLEKPINMTSELVKDLLKSVELMALVSHLQWGLWSIIRAPQAPTFEQFDFIGYANYRFKKYFEAKARANWLQ
jgi:choline kinase